MLCGWRRRTRPARVTRLVRVESPTLFRSRTRVPALLPGAAALRPFFYHFSDRCIELAHLLERADRHTDVLRPLRPPARIRKQHLPCRHRRAHLIPGHPFYGHHEEVR